MNAALVRRSVGPRAPGAPGKGCALCPAVFLASLLFLLLPFFSSLRFISDPKTEYFAGRSPTHFVCAMKLSTTLVQASIKLCSVLVNVPVK